MLKGKVYFHPITEGMTKKKASPGEHIINKQINK